MSKATLPRVREHVDPHWDARKVERELARLEERVEKRTFRQRALFGSLVLASATAALLLATGRPAPEPLAAPSTPRTLQAPVPVAEPAAPVTREPTPAEPSPAQEPELALAEQEQAQPAELESREESQRPQRKKHRRARKHETGTRVVMAGQAWRSLAREGRYHEAYLELAEAALDRANSDVDDLLLAGDAARLSGHPREAVPYYRDALARAGTGSRAHLAAFTLGRTLLRELKDARGAAQSFARAYTLAPHGPLAEEALAGEVESWARSGEKARAQEAARRYLAAFPGGRRAAEVQKQAGLP